MPSSFKPPTRNSRRSPIPTPIRAPYKTALNDSAPLVLCHSLLSGLGAMATECRGHGTRILDCFIPHSPLKEPAMTRALFHFLAIATILLFPSIHQADEPKDAPIALFNGKDLTG